MSINPSSDDKFTLLLTQLHNCVAGVLEASLAEEVGRHVEEITGYLTVTMKVDAPGALLCIQQVFTLQKLQIISISYQYSHCSNLFLLEDTV